MNETPEVGKVAYEDTAKLRYCLDVIRAAPRDPTGSEILKMLDGLLTLIERRDERDLRK